MWSCTTRARPHSVVPLMPSAISALTAWHRAAAATPLSIASGGRAREVVVQLQDESIYLGKLELA